MPYIQLAQQNIMDVFGYFYTKSVRLEMNLIEKGTQKKYTKRPNQRSEPHWHQFYASLGSLGLRKSENVFSLYFKTRKRARRPLYIIDMIFQHILLYLLSSFLHFFMSLNLD